MAEATKKPSRIALLTLCAAALAAGLIFALPAPTAAQNQPPPPKKKKLPPGTKGFEQYATRDASDKLATGGATRSADMVADKAKTDAMAAIAAGDAAYEKGQFKEAIDSFARAAMLKPDLFRAHYSLGAAYEAAGQFREAAAAYKVAIALKPDADNESNLVIAHYNLANAYAAAGQHAEAVAAYRQLIAKLDEIKSPLAQPYYNLGLSLAALNRADEAAAAFAKAVELKPDYAEAHYNLGVLHSKAERYGEAVAAFQKALAARADYPEAHYNLGLAYWLTDNAAGLAEQQRKLQAMNSPLAAELAKLAGTR